jgi:hypothetical protein
MSQKQILWRCHERKCSMKNLKDVNPTPDPAKDVYYTKFPFLGWVEPDKKYVRFIGVELIDLEVIEVVPFRRDDAYSNDDVFVYFVGRDESKLYEVLPRRWVKNPKYRWYRISTWGKEKINGESVKEALIKLGDRLPELSRIVIVSGWDLWKKIQIFKLPKEFSLAEWIEGERRKLKEQLDREDPEFK